MKTDNMPAMWALDEAAKRSGWSDWAGYTADLSTRSNDTTVTAHARTIEKHEQPPVDQDVLDVRELLRIYCLYVGGWEVRGGLIEQGLHDDDCSFLNVLVKYREFKARDNG